MAEAAPPAAVILAAGLSRRAGPTNKLLRELAGKPLLLHAVEAALASRARPVVVVLGHRAEQVAPLLAGLPVRIAINAAPQAGMAGSLAAGIAAVADGAPAAFILLGDMPHVRPATLDRLADALDAAPERSVAVPVHGGRRGNPVLWRSCHFPALMRLAGDTGGQALLAAAGDAVLEVPVEDPGILVDYDRPEDFSG